MIALTLGLAGTVAPAEQPAAPAAQPTPTPTPSTPPPAAAPSGAPGANRTGARALAGFGADMAVVSRADLAAAYLGFERALAQNPPKAEDVRGINRAFDGLTTLFFSGQFGSATKSVHELTDRVANAAPSASLRFARSLKVRLRPAVWVKGSGQSIETEVRRMYALDTPGAEGEGATFVRVRLVDESGTGTDWPGQWRLGPEGLSEVGEAAEGAKDAGGASNKVDALLKGLKPGRYRVEAVVGEAAWPSGAWTIVDEPLAKVRKGLEDRLNALAERRGAPAWAIETARSRVSVLSDDPSETNSAEFLLDAPAHARALRAEVAELERGVDPYAGREGDLWRGVSLGGGVWLPVRVYAPKGVSKPRVAGEQAGPARALVIALHGAGGDESMFMDGYGAGLIKRLADRHGFIVVSPRTETLMGSPGALDALLGAMKSSYAIDERRVYAVGHSMGAGAASALASTRAKEIAAAACLAGGPRRQVRPPCAPLLVVGAEFDPIIPAPGLAAAAEVSRKSAAPIEFRLAKDLGHTLMVGFELPGAIEWLLTHELKREPLPENR
jgi:predicted esterase